MGVHNISTPNGKKFSVNGCGVTLTFDPSFGPRMSAAFDKKQAFVDSEVLRYDSPLVPFQTGNLEHSGIMGTHVGSGLVEYIAPYAATQYYDTADTRPYDSNRGAHWFERMKAAHKQDILNGLKHIQ